jgi:membrane-associated phospholipid phosphatase
MIWFTHLESFRTKDRAIIHLSIDSFIPFVEVFVIPYFLWFFYVAVAVLLLMFQNKREYYRSCIFLFTGMTIFLIVSTLNPNGLALRPQTMPRDNIFTHMVSYLYTIDTSTNVWPSIHVYNSIGAYLAINRSNLGAKKGIRIASLILCISIILSTMLIKQHSVFDVMTAFVMAAIMYGIVYRPAFLNNTQDVAEKREKSRPQVN